MTAAGAPEPLGEGAIVLLPAPAPARRWSAAADRALRVVGAVCVVLLAVLTGVLELVLVPLRVGGVPVGLCVVLAVAVNAALPRFSVAATGARWPALLGFAAWLAVMLVAAGRTREGDLLVTGGWGLLVNLAGSLAFGAAVYRMTLVRPRVGLAPSPPTG